MKVTSFAAHIGISNGAPNLLATKVTNTQNNTPLKDTTPSLVIKSFGFGKEDKNLNYVFMDD